MILFSYKIDVLNVMLNTESILKIKNLQSAVGCEDCLLGITSLHSLYIFFLLKNLSS